VPPLPVVGAGPVDTEGVMAQLEPTGAWASVISPAACAWADWDKHRAEMVAAAPQAKAFMVSFIMSFLVSCFFSLQFLS